MDLRREIRECGSVDEADEILRAEVGEKLYDKMDLLKREFGLGIEGTVDNKMYWMFLYALMGN